MSQRAPTATLEVISTALVRLMLTPTSPRPRRFRDFRWLFPIRGMALQFAARRGIRISQEQR